MGTKSRQTSFNPRVAEDTFFGTAGFPVKIYFFIRAAGHAVTPAPAAPLVDQNVLPVRPPAESHGGAGQQGFWANRGLMPAAGAVDKLLVIVAPGLVIFV